MAKETKTEDTIPEEYRWDKLVTHSGKECKRKEKRCRSVFYPTSFNRCNDTADCPLRLVNAATTLPAELSAL